MNKVPVFAAGILLGVGVSALGFYWVSTRPTNNANSTAKEHSVSSVGPIRKDSSFIVENKNDKVKDKVTYIRAKSDSDFYPNIDRNSSLYDSLAGAFSPSENELTGEGEIIRKDRIVGVRKLQVEDRTIAENNTKSDSLLQEANNVREDQPEKIYEIEFWRSALNSRGYRMGRQKIALYGIDPEEGIALFRLEEGLFLRSGSQAYQLEASPDFRIFRPVTDKSIRKELGL